MSGLQYITGERALVLARKHAQVVADENNRAMYIVRCDRKTLPPVDWSEWFYVTTSKFCVSVVETVYPQSQNGYKLLRCHICGEVIPEGEEIGEFVEAGKSVIAHSECGLTNGLEIA